MENDKKVIICDYGGCLNPVTEEELALRVVRDCRGRKYFFYFCSEDCRKKHERVMPEINFGVNSLSDEQGFF